jgi:hypothetical protein
MQTTSVATAIVSTIVAAVLFGTAGLFIGKTGNLTHQQDHPHMGKDCKGKNCAITVTFLCDDPSNASASTCIPYTDLEAILVTSNDTFSFDIDNKFKQFGFALDPTDGIQFTQGWPNAPGNNFPCTYQNNKTFNCSVAVGTPVGLYKYAVHVVGFSKVDPWVVNN